MAGVYSFLICSKCSRSLFYDNLPNILPSLWLPRCGHRLCLVCVSSKHSGCPVCQCPPFCAKLDLTISADMLRVIAAVTSELFSASLNASPHAASHMPFSSLCHSCPTQGYPGITWVPMRVPFQAIERQIPPMTVTEPELEIASIPTPNETSASDWRDSSPSSTVSLPLNRENGAETESQVSLVERIFGTLSKPQEQSPTTSPAGTNDPVVAVTSKVERSSKKLHHGRRDRMPAYRPRVFPPANGCNEGSLR